MLSRSHRGGVPWCTAALWSLALCLALSGCYLGDRGDTPPTDSFVFPTVLTVSPGAAALYVANSDFDLRFTGGTVQALRLGELRAKTRRVAQALADGETFASACQRAALQPNDHAQLYPAACSAVPLGPLVDAAVTTGAFASGMALVHRPDGPGARLFVSVRGDPSITYFDVDDDREQTPATLQLYCDADEEFRCGAAYRIGEDPGASERGLTLPVEPVGIAADASGERLLVAHQTQGAASLVSNRWDSVPSLTHTATNLAEGPTDVASIPVPAFASGSDSRYAAGFVLTYRYAGQLDILRVLDDEASSPSRPYVVRADAAPVSVNATGGDSRGAVVVDTARRSCETSCEPNDVACERACLDIPLKVFVANRSPSSLLVGEIRSRPELPDDSASRAVVDVLSIQQSIPLSFGASKVIRGKIVGREGALEERVFVAAFDARLVYVVNPSTNEVETLIRTGRGPQGLAVDSGVMGGSAYAHLYVAHFTDSYLGVVDMDLRHPGLYGTTILRVGNPVAPDTESAQ